MMAESLSTEFTRLNVNGQNAGCAGQTRNWIPSQYPKICTGHSDGQTFTIASYNVLSHNLLARHLELYNGCNQKHLKWDFRARRLIEEIDKYQPDVLCLQEVHKANFKPLLNSHLSKKGYHGIFKERPGAENEDGCSIFYKTNVFKLAKTKAVEYDLYDSNCQGKSNVALLVALKFHSREENNVVCVANTHLLYNPCRGDVKTTQLMILLAEMDKMTSEYEHRIETERGDEYFPCPSILCGDLNLVPDSHLFRFLCGGRLDWSKRIFDLSGLPLPEFKPRGFYDSCLKNCVFIPHQITRSCRFKDGSFDTELKKRRNGIFHRFRFVSSYPHHSRPFVTSSHQGFKLNLDYILYSCARTELVEGNGRVHTFPSCEKGLHLVEWLDLPDISDNDVGPMPNQWNGSDHFLIMSRFTFF